MNFDIAPSAAERITSTATSEGLVLEDTFLRIAVVPGGCSGLTYDLGWDPVRREDDHLFDIAGLHVLLDTSAMLYLDGTTLYFSEGLQGKGFHFDNPQASRTCACGESFSV